MLVLGARRVVLAWVVHVRDIASLRSKIHPAIYYVVLFGWLVPRAWSVHPLPKNLPPKASVVCAGNPRKQDCCCSFDQFRARVENALVGSFFPLHHPAIRSLPFPSLFFWWQLLLSALPKCLVVR